MLIARSLCVDLVVCKGLRTGLQPMLNVLDVVRGHDRLDRVMGPVSTFVAVLLLLPQQSVGRTPPLIP